MIIKIKDQIQLSIYSTRALFHKYFVALNHRWICIFYIVRESPSLILFLSMLGPISILWAENGLYVAETN